MHLESSKLLEALKSVEEAYTYIEKYPNRKKEIEVCLAYKTAIILLMEIQQCDSLQEFAYGSIFSRFLGELILQPR